jgi:hypothetical protein
MILNLAKMMIKENQKLTLQDVYWLFYTQFPHIRYIDDKRDLYNSLKLLRFHGGKYIDIVLMNEEIINVNNDNDSWTLVGDSILLNNSHKFKVYNKPLSNNESLELIFKNA